MTSSSPIREYLDLSRKVEKLEKEVMKEIVTYLLVNSLRPDKRTLRAMERELGIPYSKLRRLVGKLVEEGVIVEGSVGTAKPLAVLDLDLALRKGYLKVEADLRSLISLHLLALPSSVAVFGEIKGDEFYRTVPKAPLRIEEKSRVHTLLEQMRYLPHAPREEKLLEKVEEKWPKEEVEYRKKFLEEIKAQLSKEEWSKLTELSKELEEWGVFLPTTGGLPELYIPFIRSNSFEVSHENSEQIIAEYVRRTHLPKEAIKPLRYLPYLDPWALYYRDVVMELNFKNLNEVTDEEIKEAIKRVAEKNLKFLLYLIEPLIKDIKRIGVKKVLEKWNKGLPEDMKYTKYHILSEAIPLGYASLLVCKLGNKELAEKALQYVKMLVAAVIYDYKGEKEEKETLEELAKKIKI